MFKRLIRFRRYTKNIVRETRWISAYSYKDECKYANESIMTVLMHSKRTQTAERKKNTAKRLVLMKSVNWSKPTSKHVQWKIMSQPNKHGVPKQYIHILCRLMHFQHTHAIHLCRSMIECEKWHINIYTEMSEQAEKTKNKRRCIHPTETMANESENWNNKDRICVFVN